MPMKLQVRKRIQMIKDITPPSKNTSTKDLLEEDKFIDTGAAEPIEPTFPEEGVEVAGLVDKGSKAVADFFGSKPKQQDFKDKSMDDLETAADKKQKLEEIIDERNLPEGQLIKDEKGQLIFDIADNVDYQKMGNVFERLENLPIEQLTKDVDDIFKRIETENIDEIENLDDLIKFSFSDELKKQGAGTITNDELRILAEKVDAPGLYKKVLKRQRGEQLSVEESYRAIQEALIMRKLYINAVNELNADKNNLALLDKANKYMRVYGLFLAKVNGDLSETARKLRASALAKKTYGLESEEGKAAIFSGMQALDEGINPKEMLGYHNRFLTLPIEKQSKVITKSAFQKIKEGGVEIFVNSLLSSPVTHVVNFVSNTGFNALRYTEKYIAAGLNSIPGYKSPDGVMLNEAMEVVYNFKDATKVGGQYFLDTIKSGGKASQSKLDLGNYRAVSTDALDDSWRNPDNKYKYALGKTLNAYGHFARLPGTFLVASDEMTKGAIAVVAQKQIARRKYNQVINTGGTKEQAEAASYQVMTNPTVADQQLIKEEMLEGTFQADMPPGFFSKAQQVLNIPEMKIFVPFYKTVTNIFFEQAKRNPALAFFGKKTKDDILGRNGKRAMQLSHARLLTGTGIMYTFASMAYGSGSEHESDFFITGRPPGTKTERETFYRKGLQPYSICTKKKAGDFQCTSYSRFEPISALLAISADTALTLKNPDQWGDEDTWDEKTRNLIAANVSAIVPYLTEQPFLTVFKDFQSALNRFSYTDDDNKLDALFAFLLEKVMAPTFGSVLNPFGSMGRWMEKMGDKQVYEKGLTQDMVDELRNPEFGISQIMITFYEQLNDIQKNSPFFNKDLPPKLNLWGENVMGAEGTVISPFKVTNTTFNDVDDYLFKRGFGLRMPNRKMQGIYLSVEEYQDYIKLINDPEWSGSGEHEPKLLNELQEMINSDGFLDLPIGAQRDAVTGLYGAFKRSGRERFLNKYPAIRDVIRKQDEVYRQTGKR
jgi:hypothetical protein